MSKIIRIILPGLLVAATGVGAGDLITATLAGHHIGALLWLPLLGALLKYFLTDAIARYQLDNQEHLIHGWIKLFGNAFKWPFLIYLFIWSYSVGGALINATSNAFLNLFPHLSSFPEIVEKSLVSVVFSALAFILVWSAKFKLFEKIMMLLIGMMFISVIATSFLLLDGPEEFLKGLFHFHHIPFNSPWFLSVLGGVGGTLTILCYGYWIKESEREGYKDLKMTKIDLGISYLLTGVFSLSMMIIGTKITEVGSTGDIFISNVAKLFEKEVGIYAAYLFRIGFFCGVFSSLLGVWQSVPYLFADLVSKERERSKDLKQTKAYRIHLTFLSLASLTSLTFKFQSIQLLYAIVGALFIPLCAISLVYINNREIKDARLKNTKFQSISLSLIFIFFILYGATLVYQKWA